MEVINTLVANTYFKGGPDDKFMSGLWIGNKQQEHVTFINCTFNEVQAHFVHCTFIDCENAPRAPFCTYIELASNVRIKAERRVDGSWK